MSHAPEASVAAGTVIFWVSLALYLVFLRSRNRSTRVDAERMEEAVQRE
jgi:hypothetical protein